MMDCKICQAALPNLLFDSAAPAGAGETAPQFAGERAHLAACAACAGELASYMATFALLDAWKAPAISPYFDQKLAVRLREVQAAPALGWLGSIKERLLFNTGRQFRPALAGAMALVLLVGGGGFGISNLSHPRTAQAQASPAVNDLQILDKNAQAMQQMDQLLQDDAAGSDAATPPQS